MHVENAYNASLTINVTHVIFQNNEAFYFYSSLEEYKCIHLLEYHPFIMHF